MTKRDFALLLYKAADKAISRKFLAFVVATHMTYVGILGPEHWTWIAALFVGVQSVLDYQNGNGLQNRPPNQATGGAGEMSEVPPPQR